MPAPRARLLRVAAALCCLHLASGCAAKSRAGEPSPPLVDGPEARHHEGVELLRVLNMERQMGQIMDRLLVVQLQSTPELRPFEDVLRAFLAKYMSWKSLEADFLALYVETFTAQELRDIADFYRTPTGQKALTTLPELSERGAQIGQQRVQEHSDELQSMIMERMHELQGASE